MTTTPKFVGLNTCFPRTRSTNLLAIVTADAAAAIAGESVRSSRHSERPEISALRGSNRGTPASRPHTAWAASALASVTPIRAGPISKPSAATP